jgi:hypothetical protein
MPGSRQLPERNNSNNMQDRSAALEFDKKLRNSLVSFSAVRAMRLATVSKDEAKR